LRTGREKRLNKYYKSAKKRAPFWNKKKKKEEGKCAKKVDRRRESRQRGDSLFSFLFTDRKIGSNCRIAPNHS